MFGLPTHALVVHATVGLVPVAALLAVVVAVWPAARRRYGWLSVVLLAVATVLVPLTTESGESLERRVPHSNLVEEHAELGDSLLNFVLPLLIVTVALVLLARTGQRNKADGAPGGATSACPPRPGWLRFAVPVVAAVTVLLGIGAVVQVVRIGHSGAKAVWSDTAKTASGGGEHEDGD